MERGNTPQAPQPAAGGTPAGGTSGATLDPGPAAASGGGPSRIANQRRPGRATATNADGTTVESVTGEDGSRTVTVRDADGNVVSQHQQPPTAHTASSMQSTETHPDGSTTSTYATPGGVERITENAAGETVHERYEFDDGTVAETVVNGPGDYTNTVTGPDGSTFSEHIVDGETVSMSEDNPEGGTSVWVEVVIEDLETP